jgi:hypothetical protein
MLTGVHRFYQVLRKICGPMMDGVTGDKKNPIFGHELFEHQTKDW